MVFTVHKGKRYRATVTLGFLEQFASNDVVAQKLTEAGFTDVKVDGDGGTRHATALWPLPDRSAELDSHLSDVTEIA